MIVRDKNLTEDQLPGFLEEICGIGSDGFSIQQTRCPSTNNKISYHINKLSPAHRLRVEEHADNCPECYEALYTQKKEFIELAIYLKRIKPDERRSQENL